MISDKQSIVKRPTVLFNKVLSHKQILKVKYVLISNITRNRFSSWERQVYVLKKNTNILHDTITEETALLTVKLTMERILLPGAIKNHLQVRSKQLHICLR